LHESSVQALPSSQLGDGPPTHNPPEQVSFVVQALPSLHVTALLVWVQPVVGSQASVVQTIPSSQFGGGPLTHDPAAQVSPIVQAFPSSQGTVLFVNTHKPPEQVSVVHPFPSLHSVVVHSVQLGVGVPVQVPLPHKSPDVQACASSQELVLFA